MTLDPDNCKLYYKHTPMVFMKELFRSGLFLEKCYYTEDEDKRFSLTSKVHLLMKKLRQDYNTIMFMPSEDRDLFVEWEMDIIKKEEEEYKKP